jgi:hypothetical protein
MEAIAHFGQRRFCDVQKLQSLTTVPARRSFHDVRRDRIGGAPRLAAELVSFDRRKSAHAQLMQPDEQIVGPLPGDKRMVRQARHGAWKINTRAEYPTRPTRPT